MSDKLNRLKDATETLISKAEELEPYMQKVVQYAEAIDLLSLSDEESAELYALNDRLNEALTRGLNLDV